MISLKRYTQIAFLATLLAFALVVLGAFVRLSHAGLSCPDWPGCYGQILVPESKPDIAVANLAFPERRVDPPRAWKEMLHRYLAGILGLFILGIAVMAWRRRHMPGQLVAVPLILLVLVIFQALLGMWTVTLKLKPIIVTAHLLGGMTTLALLWWLSIRQSGAFLSAAFVSRTRAGTNHGRAIALAVVLLYFQIALGGWTSANYAALACPDFPQCGGQWLPPLDLAAAFTPWHGLGRSYEGGHLDNAARVTIHFVHRVGALLVAGYFLLLGMRLLRSEETPHLKKGGAALLFVVCVQLGLGITNVVAHLPIEIAVAHNGGAALLLLTTLCVYHMAYPPASVSV